VHVPLEPVHSRLKLFMFHAETVENRVVSTATKNKLTIILKFIFNCIVQFLEFLNQ
jgi:hypothetical protein